MSSDVFYTYFQYINDHFIVNMDLQLLLQELHVGLDRRMDAEWNLFVPYRILPCGNGEAFLLAGELHHDKRP